MVSLRKVFFLLIVAAGAGRPVAGRAGDNAPFCVPKKLVTMLQRDQGGFLAVFATEKTSTPGKRIGDCYNGIFWSEDGVHFSALPGGMFHEGYSSQPPELVFADPVYGKKDGDYKMVLAKGKDSVFGIACGKAVYQLTAVSDDRMKAYEEKLKSGKLALSYQMPKERRLKFLLKDPETGVYYVVDGEKYKYDNTFEAFGPHLHQSHVPLSVRLLVGKGGRLEEKQLKWYVPFLDGGTLSVEADGLKILSPTLWGEDESKKIPKVNGNPVMRLDRGKNQVDDLGALLKSIGLDPALYRESEKWRTPCSAPQARDEAPEQRPDGDPKRAE